MYVLFLIETCFKQGDPVSLFSGFPSGTCLVSSEVRANLGAFAALKEDETLVTWGDSAQWKPRDVTCANFVQVMFFFAEVPFNGYQK